MRRLRASALVVGVGLLSLGATSHPEKSACDALVTGFNQARDLSAWIDDQGKVDLLRPSFATVEFHAVLLAETLDNGGSIESTRTIQRDLVAAGNAFLTAARALGVAFPDGDLERYLEHTRVCSEAY